MAQKIRPQLMQMHHEYQRPHMLTLKKIMEKVILLAKLKARFFLLIMRLCFPLSMCKPEQKVAL